jgi:hypothetical protein
VRSADVQIVTLVIEGSDGELTCIFATILKFFCSFYFSGCAFRTAFEKLFGSGGFAANGYAMLLFDFFCYFLFNIYIINAANAVQQAERALSHCLLFTHN